MCRSVVYFAESAAFGGAEQVLLTLLAGLDRRCWRPVLVHHEEPSLAPLLERADRLGVKLRAVPRMQGKSTISGMSHLVGILRAEQAAVFHAHLNWPLACRYGLLAATLARVPAIVATEHLFVDIPWRRSIYLQRLICAGVDRYLAVSDEVARRLRQTLKIPARKIRVVHNGIPLVAFDRLTSRARRASLTGDAERPIVLTTARLAEQKGQGYLLEAAALVPEATFVLAGDGPDRAGLEARARDLGLTDRVLFLGHRHDVPDLLASCDLFVLPSLFEGHPLSILEAMAAGRPVIATAIGGTDEAVIHRQTGILIPPADSVALASAITAVLTDPVLARRLGEAGRARVRRKFAAEIMVRRVTDIYGELLAPTGAGCGRG
jgi:glycosyltransferase involved in cell wall biosynthesis